MSKRMWFLGALALLFASVQSAQAGSPCALNGFADKPFFAPLETAFMATKNVRAFLDTAALVGLQAQSGADKIAAFKTAVAEKRLADFVSCKVIKQGSSPGGLMFRTTAFYPPGRHGYITLFQKAIPIGTSSEKLEYAMLFIGIDAEGPGVFAGLQ